MNASGQFDQPPYRSAHGRRGPADAADQLYAPILARAIDLGRGPAGLVGWVRHRLAAAGRPDEPAAQTARRLAHELADLVRRGGVTDTLVLDVRETIRLPVPARVAAAGG